MNSQDYVNELFNLEGHVGIVTGASRGLGMGIAQVLTNAGATVYNLDIIERSDEKEITGNMIDIHVDLTDREAVREIVERIAADEGHLDFLINNAGITYKCRAEEYPMEKYKQIQDVNLESIFELCRMCYPYLKESRYIGRIVSISSMAAYMGHSGVVPYCMTKSGVKGLTIGLAEEWKHDNILVNSVAPGWFSTKLNQEMYRKNPERHKAALAKPMLGRFGDPVEIGYMMLFLLSQGSTYLTGQDFAVDGGALSHGF